MSLRKGGIHSRLAPILFVSVVVACVWLGSQGTIAAVSLLGRVDHEADVLFFGLRLFQWIAFGLFLMAEDTRHRTDRRSEHNRNKRFLFGFVIASAALLALSLRGMTDFTGWRQVSIALGFSAAVGYSWWLARVAGLCVPNDARRSGWLALVFAVVLSFEVGFCGWAAHEMGVGLLLRMINDPTVLIRGIGTVFLPARWTALSWIADSPGSASLWLNAVCLFVVAGTAYRFRVGKKLSSLVDRSEKSVRRLAFRPIAWPWLLPAAVGCVLFWIPVTWNLARFIFPYASQISNWGIALGGVIGLWFGWWIRGVTSLHTTGGNATQPDEARTLERRVSFASTFVSTALIGMATGVPWTWITAALVSMGVAAWPTRNSHELSAVFTGTGIVITLIVTWVAMRLVGRISVSERAVTTAVLLVWLGFLGLRGYGYSNITKQRKNAE